MSVFALVQKPDKYFTDMVGVQISKELNQITVLVWLFLTIHVGSFVLFS